MAISNFAVIKQYFPSLANLGILAEKNIYTDSNTALIKAGMLGENIAKLVGTYENVTFTSDKFIDMIKALEFPDHIIEEPELSIMHKLRIKRNDAAHKAYESVDDAKVAVSIAYSLCEWFVECYGDNGDTYEHKDFVLPKLGEVIYADATEEVQAELESEDAHKASNTPEATVKERKEKAKKKKYSRNMSEAETRVLIDEALYSVGWEVDSVNLRYSKGTRPEKGRNLAIAEWPTDSTVASCGFADYALFIGEKLVAIVEAKAKYKDIPSVIDNQCKEYSRNIRAVDDKYTVGAWGEYKVPLVFATNGRPYIKQFEVKSGIWALDLRKNTNAPHALSGWMSPIGIEEALKKDIHAGNQNLQNTGYDMLLDKDGLNLRDYQIKAIEKAEGAIIAGAKTALLAMATGTGKTRTVLGMVYRFLKAERFKRILFLVDRTALGEQAQDVFAEVKLEELMTLDNIYNIAKLTDAQIDPAVRVRVSTVQGMIKRILYNDDDVKPAVSDYDLIIIDEAHRGYTLDKEMSDAEEVYRTQDDYQSKYRQVIEYFDAVKIALTATPALHTVQIFGSPVFRYTYREAVIDGWLVDHDAPHLIKTKLSDEGITYKKGDKIQVYNTATDKIINLDLMEDEIKFDVDKFNKQIVVPAFNKVVLEEIAANINPDNVEECGKTLIYAVDDTHADMIVDILKKYYTEMGIPEEAIMKITGSVGGGNPKKVQEAIKKFKNERFPSVVVTVDLLTTGIDVPEITTLVFMRRVKSRILFEQMLGRATRLCPAIHKTHFEIYDPVGTYDSLEPFNTMKPTVANPGTSFTEMVDGLAELTEEQAEQTIAQIVAKLQRKKRNLTDEEKAQFTDITGGKDIENVITTISTGMKGLKCDIKTVKDTIVLLRNAFVYLDSINHAGTVGRKIVISDAEDEIIKNKQSFGAHDKAPKDYLDEFAEYLDVNKNVVDALNIVCTRPSDLTRAGLRSLKLTLEREGFTEQQLNTAIAKETNVEMTADIISLVRRYALGSPLLSHEERIKKAVQKLKANNNFSTIELTWIDRIQKYLLNESVVNAALFDEDERFKGRIQKQFKHDLKAMVVELNTYLYEDLRGAI